MRARQFIVCLGIGLVAAGCAATARRGEPVSGELPMGDPAIARGRKVFMHHCEPCHPGGEAGLAPSLNDKPLPGFLIKLQVRAGMGVMPPFPPQKISDAELDALVAYMMALRHQRPGE